jgi:transcriptional regulator with XRE-family HTH domain
MVDFSERLKQFRGGLAMNQKEFAAHIGISAATLSAYETGAKNPSISVLKALTEKYDTSIDWLCGLSEHKNLRGNFEKYSDIIRALLMLETQAVEIHVNATEFREYDDSCPQRCGFMRFHDARLATFFEEWARMREIHGQGLIDDEVYNLWIEKTIKKYDVPIGGTAAMEEADHRRPTSTQNKLSLHP